MAMLAALPHRALPDLSCAICRVYYPPFDGNNIRHSRKERSYMNNRQANEMLELTIKFLIKDGRPFVSENLPGFYVKHTPKE